MELRTGAPLFLLTSLALQRHTPSFSGRNIADVAETLNIVAVLSNNAFVLSIMVAVLTIIDADLTFPWGLNPFWLLLKSLLPAAFQLVVRQCLSQHVFFNQKHVPVICLKDAGLERPSIFFIRYFLKTISVSMATCSCPHQSSCRRTPATCR